MCLGVVGIILVVMEIINLNKAAKMTLADFPNLTSEQLELKRLRMRQSAWWLLGGAVFMMVVGNMLLFIATAVGSQPGLYAAYIIGIGGLVISLIVSAFYGSAAARLK